jgi:4'-phosphopantetheinyl transferase
VLVLSDVPGPELHIWIVRIDERSEPPSRLESLLSPDEIQRANRFVFAHDRAQYVTSRGALRAVVGAYIGAAPEAVAFSYAERGKPYTSSGQRPIEFNLSHARGVAAIAVSTRGPVGIDVENVERTVDVDTLSRRFFAPDEAAELMAMSEPDRREAFFRCWTSKEAYIKALGDGLACPLDSFSVSVRADEPPMIKRIDGGDPSMWTLRRFRPAASCVGAVVVAWQPSIVSLREFSDPKAPWAGLVTAPATN